jgi:PAS domain S-box-containing protein
MTMHEGDDFMLNSIRRFFTAPVFEDDNEKTQSAKLLYQIITVIWGLPLLLIIIMILNPAGRGEVLPPAIVISIILFSLMLITRLGWVGIANTVITGMVILVFAYADFQNAGNVQPSTLVTAIAIIMSGLLLGRRAPLVTAILIVISHSAIVYLQLQGKIEVVSSPALGFENMIITGIMIFMIGFLYQFVISRLQFALKQARKDEEELQLRNRELEELSKSLEQRVADRTKVLSSVAEISTTASTVLDTDQLLQQVVDLAKERFDFYHAHIYLLNEAGDTLVLSSGAGDVGRQMVAEGRSIPLNREQSIVTRAAREKKGVTVNDVTQTPDFLPNPLLPDTRSEMAVPMMIGEQVLGVLDVQSEVVGRFAEADVAVQSTLASQIASAVQNARLYTRAETVAQDAQSLVDNAPEAIIVVDLATGLFANPNENAVRLYGLPREELVTVGPAQMSPPRQPDGRDSTEKAMEKIGEAMQGGTPIFEWMHRNGQGEDFPCEIRLVRLPGEHPRVRASVADITERKRNEDLTRQRAQQQEALNLITQKIQSATTIESALQVTARELGHALGMKPTLVTLEPDNTNGNRKSDS